MGSMRSTSEFFDRVARRYDRVFAPDPRSTEADLRPLLAGLPPGATVLDLGCGTGRAWPLLVAAELRVIAVDASAEMLREGGRRSSAASVARVRADLYRPWPIADRSIDLVLALHSVLAHPAGDPGQAWRHVGREIARVGREGVRVAIDLPEPAWARLHLRRLPEDDRYLHADEGGAEIVAVVPEPMRVVEAMGLPLELQPCLTGVRALGSITPRS
jgi:SAM-dependent methyltransferase